MQLPDTALCSAAQGPCCSLAQPFGQVVRVHPSELAHLFALQQVLRGDAQYASRINITCSDGSVVRDQTIVGQFTPVSGPIVSASACHQPARLHSPALTAVK